MDLYTKVVLTVIAVTLSVIALKDTGAIRAHADTPQITRVLICDSSNTQRCAGISDRGELDVLSRAAQ